MALCPVPSTEGSGARWRCVSAHEPICNLQQNPEWNVLPRGCPRAVALPCWAATQILQRARRPTWDDRSTGRHVNVNWKSIRCPRGTGQFLLPLCEGARMCHAHLAAPAGEERGRRRRDPAGGRQDAGDERVVRAKTAAGGALEQEGSRGATSRVQARGGEERWNPSPPSPGLAPAGQWTAGTGQWAVTSGQWVTLANVGKCKWMSASGEGE